MADDEQHLIDEARESLEKTQELREESGLDGDDERGPPPEDDDLPDSPPEPSAKTSSGEADDVLADE
jgi:hypothetical protein